MTDITEKLIAHVANLARLRFPETDLERYTHKARHIIEYVEKLKSADTASIDPTAHAVETTGFMRDDVAIPFENRDGILENAPDRDGHFYQVPKVL